MPFAYETMLNWHIPDVVHDYTERDTMLYALGLGCGHDPLDADELRFVYEEGLEVLPTIPVVLGRPGPWMKEPGLGLDWVRMLHGEQTVTRHAPIPPRGSILGRSTIVDVIDKGAGKGALIYHQKQVIDRASDTLLATTLAVYFARGDGGCGGPAKAQPAPHPLPDRPADTVVDLATRPEAALIYRLSGDYNPLHADPKVAREAGFERPILHGLCTYGVIGRAVVRAAAGGDPARVRSMAGRFTAPVYPGETIRTEVWRDGNVASFRASVVERGVTVFGNGRAEVA